MKLLTPCVIAIMLLTETVITPLFTTSTAWDGTGAIPTTLDTNTGLRDVFPYFQDFLEWVYENNYESIVILQYYPSSYRWYIGVQMNDTVYCVRYENADSSSYFNPTATSYALYSTPDTSYLGSLLTTYSTQYQNWISDTYGVTPTPTVTETPTPTVTETPTPTVTDTPTPTVPVIGDYVTTDKFNLLKYVVLIFGLGVLLLSLTERS